MSATGWGIVNKRGALLGCCIRNRRTSAIKALVGKEEGWQKRWRRFKGWGCMAVRVTTYVQGERHG